MKLKIPLLFIIVLILIPIVMAASNNANNCCYPPYPSDGTGVSGHEVIITKQDNCNAIGPTYFFVPNCDDGSGIIPSTNLIKQCCCNNTIVEDFGALTIGFPPYVVYEKYCEGLGYNSTSKTKDNTCDCSHTKTSSTKAMNHISGYVFLDNDSTPLEGVSVQAENGFYISNISLKNGFYDLGNIPGVDNGFNKFSATVPDGYSYNSSNGPVILDCPVVYEEKQLSGEYKDVEINFTLNCTEIGPACEPVWNYSEWSQCTPYGGEYIKIRDVWDENNCGTTLGRPISVLTQRTPAPEGNNYDCPLGMVGGVCNNGVLDPYEQCDKNLSSQITQYKTSSPGKSSTTAPSCGSLGFEDNDGFVGCRNDCSYDYSNCVAPCDVCDDVSKCDTCEKCSGAPICKEQCTNTTVEFLPNYKDRKTNRNVLESYKDQTFISGIYYAESSTDVEIKWHIKHQSSSCQNQVIGYDIMFCEESADHPNKCKIGSEKYVFSKQGTTSQTLKNILKPEVKNYCYNICTLKSDGSKDCVYNNTADDPLACFSTGDKECYTWHEPGLNCVKGSGGLYHPTGCYVETINGKSQTNLSMMTSEQCSETKQCVETKYVKGDPRYPGAKCNQAGACELCNGLFGLFASQNLPSQIVGETETTLVSNCKNFEFNPKNKHDTPETDQKIGLCYEDKAEKTPFTFYNTCKQVQDCYDYKTEETCSNDPCFKFTTVNDTEIHNNCEWRYSDKQLGIGVCAPTIEEKEDCRKCDNESPLGFCNEDLCSLYGNQTCYFKEKRTHNVSSEDSRDEWLFDQNTKLRLIEHSKGPFISTCMNKKDMACIFYQTKEDCVGSREMHVDVVYDNDTGNGRRIAGTNNQTNTSDDLFGFGDCKWIDNGVDYGCYKDSDDYYTNQTPESFSDDCFDSNPNNKNIDCFRDVTPPTTNLSLRPVVEQEQYLDHTRENYLPVYGINELANITFTASDNLYSQEHIKTFVSLVPQSCKAAGCYLGVNCTDCETKAKAESCMKLNCPVYPLYNIEDYAPNGNQFKLLNKTLSQEYLLLYYSEDEAKNLEVVKNKSIFVDVTGPELKNFTYDVKSKNEYGDIYSTNLTINFSISEPSFCDAWLTPQLYPEQKIGGQEVHNLGKQFTAFYRYLPDANYHFHIFCHDDYENDLIKVKNIQVEGNTAITNPKPKGKIFASTKGIILSIETTNNASCRFDSKKTPYNESKFDFETTGGTNHSYSPTFLNSTESKPYTFYTSCKFENGSITEMLDGDVISFTIDHLAPKVNVLARTSDNEDFKEYNAAGSNWTKKREFKLICDDYDPKIPIEQFACNKTEYCFAPGMDLETFTVDNCTSQLFTSENKEVTFTVDYQNNAYEQLYYRSIDNGGNEGSFKRVHMKIRDTSFVQPKIYLQ